MSPGSSSRGPLAQSVQDLGGPSLQVLERSVVPEDVIGLRRLVLLGQLAGGTAVEATMASILGAPLTLVLVRNHRDRRVERLGDAGLEQQRHLDDRYLGTAFRGL